MEQTPSQRRPQDMRVLIVDDDDEIREMLAMVLEGEGFQVEGAIDGLEGLDKITASPPHLVYLDLMMPRFGGFEVMKRMQKGETAKIPIIIISGHHEKDPKAVEKVLAEPNVVDYLKKPVDIKEVAALAHKTLGTQSPN